MAIIPFKSLVKTSHFETLVKIGDSEDVQSQVCRLVFSLSGRKTHVFEENGQVIQLDNGACFVRPNSHSHWLYRPQAFASVTFEINNPDWNSHLQQVFLENVG